MSLIGLTQMAMAMVMRASRQKTVDQPSGYVLNPVDCDDTNSSVNPAADEICDNGMDDNCNGTEDEGCDEDTGNPGSEPSGETERRTKR